MKKQLEESSAKEKHFVTIFNGYDKMLTQMLSDHKLVVEEKETALNHLANLENAFSDLLTKYERAKTIIQGFMTNEALLKEQQEAYKDTVKNLEERYEDLKEHATQRLSKANVQLNKNDNKHIAETAKLKSKILQSKAKINDLEKRISTANIKPESSFFTENSMFAPLKNNFIK